jgi:aminoglycoside phosphotransferase (APT) family kinase protein
VVLKVYTRQDYHVRKDNVGMFRGLGALRVPKCLGRSSRHHLAAIEWLEGVSLRSTLLARSAARWSAVGQAFARVHAQKPRKVQTFWTAESYAALLVDAAVRAAEIAPDLGERARRLAASIGEKLLQRHWRARRAIHGDLSADHVVLQDGKVGILDFDRAAYGDPRMDLGSFRARLECDVLDGALTEHEADACFAAILDAYRGESVKDVTRKVERFVAASLLQLAAEPFRHRREEWPRRMEAILGRAEAFARGPAGD